MQQFSLNPEFIKKWPKILYFIAVGVVVIVLAVLGYLLAVYILDRYIYWYLIWFAIIVLFFVLVTLALKKTHHIHVHHYTIGMVLVVLIGYQSIPAALMMGFCNGMMIEGGSRWGYDPIWIKNEPPQDENQNKEDDPEKG